MNRIKPFTDVTQPTLATFVGAGGAPMSGSYGTSCFSACGLFFGHFWGSKSQETRVWDKMDKLPPRMCQSFSNTCQIPGRHHWILQKHVRLPERTPKRSPRSVCRRIRLWMWSLGLVNHGEPKAKPQWKDDLGQCPAKSIGWSASFFCFCQQIFVPNSVDTLRGSYGRC